MRSIRSYMPDEQAKSKIVFSRIGPKLLGRVKQVAAHNNWKISDMVRSALEKFCDDEEPRSGGYKLPEMSLMPSSEGGDPRFGSIPR